MRPFFRLLALILLVSPSWMFSQTSSQLDWAFPLPRVHTGMLLANGTQGLMVWGEGRELRITVARAGFWDHRGGNDFSTRITYAELKVLLEAGNASGIEQAFALPPSEVVSPQLGHPQQLGGARLVITLPEGWTLSRGTLLLGSATLQIVAQRGSERATLSVRQSPTQELALVEMPADLSGAMVRLVPAYEFLTETYERIGLRKPSVWESTDKLAYIATQYLPADEPLSVGFRKDADRLWLGTSLASDSESRLKVLLDGADQPTLIQESDMWWQAYWQDVPMALLPDPALQEIYDYGLYKQGCATPPQGIACALQGPFMEDYQLPPWSNDYHFNINMEMIYYPALMSGRYAHLEPLWRLLDSWKGEIQKNGETFFGREGALMLPHSVDDRGKVVGTFWTGTIDHACTAWMAQLAWLHYRYSGDREVLTNTAFPLLVGAFEGYWAMLEQDSSGVFHLPVSVSPEYRGSAMNAWGRDASFQLAALHAICLFLPEAANTLQQPIDPRWQQVSNGLPPYTTFEGIFHDEWQQSNERIALWEGMDLIESHRHHSHLGAIWPFATIDPLSEDHAEVVANSLRAWRYRGAGGWSGWCVPWASILMARTNQAEAAVNWLRYWQDNFVNEGRGTLHNANTEGHSIISHPVWDHFPERRVGEVMQLDAGFGALIAVYELLVQQRHDGLHVFPGLSIYWKEASFERVRAEGGFLISARVQGGQTTEVTVEATRAEKLVLHPGLGNRFSVNGVVVEGTIWEVEAQAGQKWVLRRLP